MEHWRMVNAVPEYEKHPIVINGCSELFVQLWGEMWVKGAQRRWYGIPAGECCREIEGNV